MKRLFAGILVCCLMAWSMPARGAGDPAATLAEGWRFYEAGDDSAAAAAFETIARDGQKEISRNARLGLAYVRVRQKRLSEAEVLLRRLVAEDYRPRETAPLLVDVLVLMKRFDAAAGICRQLSEPLAAEKRNQITGARLQADFEVGSETARTAEDFLKAHYTDAVHCRRPDLFFRAAGIAEPSPWCGRIYQVLLNCPLTPSLHQGVLESLAWHHYNRQELDDAETVFNRLIKDHPGHRGAALGLGYIRLNTDRAATALEPLEASKVPDDPEILKLKRIVYIRLGWTWYDRGAWSTANEYARRALKISPEDADARLLMAWIDLKQGNTDAALTAFEKIFQARPTPENALQLMDAQLAAGQPDAARKTAEVLSLSPKPDIRRRAADFFFSQKEAIRAARLIGDPTACYANADAVQLWLAGYFRHREGDPGMSQLDEQALPLEFSMAPGRNSRIFMGVTFKRLDSGTGPSPLPVGSFYRYIDGAGQHHRLITDASTLIPQAGFRTEGKTRWTGRLATTPIGGEISPTLTGQVKLNSDYWQLSLHRCSVIESILSTTGLQDPYTDEDWGRVVRSGISVGAVLSIGTHHWVSSAMGGDYYQGHQVWDNHRLTLDISAGRTWLEQEAGILSAGVFLHAQHFVNNTNYFTYGHGGYYSPALMTMTGPFFRYTSALCHRFRFDVQAAVGWLHEQTEDSPRYPLLDSVDPAFNAAAQAEAGGTFQGETSDGVGYSLRAEGGYLLSSHLAINGYASAEQSSDYAEWAAGLRLQWYFQPQHAFWQHESMFERIELCSNR